MTTAPSLTAAAGLIVDHPPRATPLESTSATTTYHRMTVGGVGVFYREAGWKEAPTIVLLHGFPSSSREFDTLIPLLATRYHLIAPDFPGFGQSDAPPRSSYAYTFANLARTTNDLLDQPKIYKYIFYLHDYGGPVGFRIMLAHPERLQALITRWRIREIGVIFRGDVESEGSRKGHFANTRLKTRRSTREDNE